MGYEIDFLPVGDKSSGGDAIALRYGNLHGPRSEQTVIVIDGGYSDDGEALVSHIRSHYLTDVVDIVVSTHPDRDHITGLEVVLDQLKVRTLVMHQPWQHSIEMATARKYGFTKAHLREKLEKSLEEVSALGAIAQRQGINIVEPFTGVATHDGCFRILGPSREFYESLLPTVLAPVAAGARAGVGPYDWVFTKAKEALRKLLEENLDIETLRDDGETTANNNTSTICLLEVDGHRSLFTPDAGIPALELAVAVLEAEGFQPGALQFCQIPHHGSRRNVGPSVLDRLLGPKGQRTTRALALVSAPPENPDLVHPASKVTNAFRRRGFDVHGTQGVAKWHRHDAPIRDGYISSVPIPFYDKVEEDSEN